MVKERVKDRMRQLHGELERPSITDPLTGLSNRNGLMERVRELWQKEEEQFISLIMIDVDDFKDYNDDHGYLSGDVLLTRLANAIHQCFYEETISPYRIGGDEFLILISNVEEEQINQRIQTFQVLLSTLYQSRKSLRKSTNLTVSLGFALPVSHYQYTWEELFSKANQALLQAKSQGRNQVVRS